PLSDNLVDVRSGRDASSSRCQVLLSLPRERQSERECRTSAELALDFELLTVQLDDLTGERQPQARTPGPPSDNITPPVEPLPEVVEIGGGDAGSVVAHSHASLTRAVHGGGAHRGVGPAGRVPGGV